MATTTRPGSHTLRAPHGTEFSCKRWQQEASLRMLRNNLDTEVAERPEDLVAYGGSQVIVADGTPAMRERLERVLTNAPGIGDARHADAGYERAVETAREREVRLPMDSAP